MSRILKTLCKKLPKSKVRELCDKAEFCNWEKELLLDWLCEPREKTIESFEYNTENNYRKRLMELETRVSFFLSENPLFLSLETLSKLLLEELENKY